MATNRAPTPTPPPGLRCLVKYYVGTAQFDAGAWWLVLPDGQRLAYDDGKQKSQEGRLAAPDLEDTFHDVYPIGAITPIVDASQDPGRYRVDALFRATYGQTANEVKAQLVPVTFGHHTLRVHQRAASAFRAVVDSLSKGLASDPRIAPVLDKLAGTFNWRNIAGTEQLSAHSFGVSLDVNTRYSDYWRWQNPNPTWKNQIPTDLVQVFEQHGFIWGGRWHHFDTMHFEYRPELLDRTCYQDH